ncbi:hypothetical protein OH77DRAFT_1068077 [Trametes cingulata]|nr:hypothetical protein OH77DRAFT_1068077 [Trametes cingulata]
MAPLVKVLIEVPHTAQHPSSTATRPERGRHEPDSTHTEVTTYSRTLYEFAEPRPLSWIDPTVTFASSSQLPLYSRCIVTRGDTTVHVSGPVAMAVEASQERYAHSTELAPGYWGILCSCEDPSTYTILQEIMTEAEPADHSSAILRVQSGLATSSRGMSLMTDWSTSSSMSTRSTDGPQTPVAEFSTLAPILEEWHEHPIKMEEDNISEPRMQEQNPVPTEKEDQEAAPFVHAAVPRGFPLIR